MNIVEPAKVSHRRTKNTEKKRNGCLPPTLYVQADNCAKDNKNNYVLMFLCQLVRAKIFKKVKLNFLMVGHTHEDIDQMFSRISSKLNKTSTETLPKLHEAIQQSFTPMPHVEHFESVWHCKGQFEGCRKIVGLKAPHVFRFKLGEDGNVQVSVKDWPLRDEEYRITDIPEIPDITNGLNIVVPRVEKIMPVVNAISSDLRKYHAAGRLTTEDVEWWQNYLQKLQSSRTIRPCIPMLTGLPKYRSIQRSHHSDIESSLRQALNAQIEKLQHVSALTLSRQRIRI